MPLDAHTPDGRAFLPDGEEAKRLRKARGMTQEQLARVTELSKRTIEGIESKSPHPVFVANLARVADALGMPLVDLVSVEEKAQFAFHRGRGSEAVEHSRGDRTATASLQLPSTIPDLVGHDQLIEGVATRLREGGGVGLSALRGMGGIGKTTLAVRVAHEVRSDFPDAQIFIDLLGVSETPMTTSKAMTRLILALNPAATLPAKDSELADLYRGTLLGKRALIVLDNAASESQVSDLITGPPAGFIITSRNALTLERIASVEVKVFSPQDSFRLLRGILSAKGNDPELKTVAELCGHLPLALRVAGDFLRVKDGWSVAQYISALDDERLKWLKVGDDSRRDVEAVLKLSSVQLVRDDVGLATRWHFLADSPSDFGLDAVAAAWNMRVDDHKVQGDIQQLVDRSLVLFDVGKKRYRLHDLMKPIAAGLFA